MDDLDALFNKRFLPKGYLEWENISENHPQLNHLYTYPFLCAFFLFIIRYLFERFIARPIGIYFGISDNNLKEHVNENDQVNKNSEEVLENYYKICKEPSEAILIQLSKDLKKPYEYVSEWFKAKHKNRNQLKMKKFTESAWRFTFYISIFLYGLYSLIDKSWFWDTKQCWIGYPNFQITSDIFWYYMIELGFYWCLLFSQFTDVRRKDFWQMFLHHILTILLMTMSYSVNFARVGSLVLVLHDCADFWLELAKMAKYAKFQRLCDSSFIIFAFVWFFTRLIVYPMKILHTTTYECTDIVGKYGMHLFFNGMLYTLQVLHVIWFYLICRVAYIAIRQGKVEKDDRSESGDSSDFDKKKQN